MSIQHHPDKEAYNRVWDAIDDTVKKYNQAHPERQLKIKDHAKECIWDAYVQFNNECRKKYMAPDVERIDRHKVIAAYMYAIIKGGLIEYTELADENGKYLFDEKIAVTVGMSLLRSFVITAIDASNKTAAQKDLLKQRIDNGIRFPETNHGKYRSNLEIELYYTKIENKYNILSLSNVLYLLETITLDAVAVNPVKRKLLKWFHL